MHTKKDATPEKAERTYCNIYIKGAVLGDSYSVHLNGAFKRSFGGTITEQDFTITIPTEKTKKISLVIKPKEGRDIRHEIPTEEDTTIDLTPLPEEQAGEEKSFLVNPLRAKVEQRQKELSGTETAPQAEEEKQIVNDLQEQVEEKRKQAGKKSFWDKLK